MTNRWITSSTWTFPRSLVTRRQAMLCLGDGEYPAIYSIAKFRKANSKRGSQTLRPWSGWHADTAINPPSISILRGVVVPPYGGDTMWTNLAAAYEGLSPALQAWLETLLVSTATNCYRIGPIEGI